MLVCVHTFDELVDYMVYIILMSICTSFYKGVKVYTPFAIYIYTGF